MAKVDLSKLFKNLRGKIGGLVFRCMPDGSIVVSSAPTYKKKKGTPAQKAYRHGTFRERTQWAKWAQHEYPIYAQLAAERPMVHAYNMALSDISHPPVIHRVLRKEGRILVQASDDVMVHRVKVDIRDEQGRLLEWGEAVHLEGDMWEYTAKIEGKKLIVRAFDIPGNSACMVLE
jgi:hypothetical protein